MAGLVLAIHVLDSRWGRRGCPGQARVWQRWFVAPAQRM